MENHHVSATFAIINSEGYNIFADLTTDEYKAVRKMMIELVLATDAANHFTELGKFKSRVSADDFTPESDDDKMAVLKMAVHLADISNPVKNFNLALLWTGLLYDEFFKQGDQEEQAERNKSYLMDRYTTNIAGCSIGFMNILVAPAYDALIQVIPLAQVCMDNLNSNKERWEELKDEFGQRMNNKKNFIPESRGVIKGGDEDTSMLPQIMSSRGPNQFENTDSNLLNTGPLNINQDE